MGMVQTLVGSRLVKTEDCRMLPGFYSGSPLPSSKLGSLVVALVTIILPGSARKNLFLFYDSRESTRYYGIS